MAMEWSEEYRELMDRFERLEVSHFDLKQQFKNIQQQATTTNAKTKTSINHTNNNNNNNGSSNDMNFISSADSGDMTSLPGWGYLPGESPYRRVLDYMGHALYVTRAPSGEIIFWNRAAEKLFGYKDYEIVGHRVVKLLIDEERHHPSAVRFLERLNTVESWSGQIPLKKRTGQIFMAIVTKTPLYEEGELVGIVTVAHDAAVFNSTSSGNTRTHHQDHADQQPKGIGINLRKIQWRAQPQIAAVPHLASSVSNLASKVLSRKRGDVTCNMCRTPRESEEADVDSQDAKADRPPRAPMPKLAFSLSIGKSRSDRMTSEGEETTSEFCQPSKIAAKVFSKLQIGATANLQKTMDEKIHDNGSEDTSVSKEGRVYQRCYSTKRTSDTCNLDTSNHSEYENSGAYHYQGSVVSRRDEHLPSSSSQSDWRLNMKSVDVDDASPRQSDPHKFSGSGESSGSSSSRGDNDSRVIVDCPILWKDLQLREEIGHGSFAVVYRGVWNGSDVAVKVYSGNQYNDQTLLDYKKEIDIMRRLRHPNVLLFMGAVCSEEKLAIVTEYMTRGSLFKTLHRNKHVLDLKRRLRMAIDVARGMNYLHHRSPPIVHRDLKSSNLLVDKSWTVKVGDFGLSKLKNATFLTAKSGRGTPQWMAPEVLRNEPTTEKSDVYSFGVILWELMTESIPWSNLNSLQVVGVVGFMDQRLDLPANMDPQVSSMISDCWRSNPEDRPSFEDIIYRTTDIVQAAGIGMAAKATSVP